MANNINELLPCFCSAGHFMKSYDDHDVSCPAYYREAVANDKRKAVEAMREACARVIEDRYDLDWSEMPAAIRRLEV